MRLAILIFLAWLIAYCPSWAADQRFVEFTSPRGETETYDLSTVQMIQPGRFTIMNTSIDEPDVMKAELKVLDALRTYCRQPDGHYPPPNDLLMLGSPDMPIHSIDVVSYPPNVPGNKVAYWYYPYDRLAVHTEGETIPREASFDCKDSSREEQSFFWERRKLIMNGTRTKWLFDCRRGLSGFAANEDDDSSDILTSFVEPDTYGNRVYRDICEQVTHERLSH